MTTPHKVVKPGYLTTEFWVTVATDVGAIAAASANVFPDRYAGLLVAVSTFAYSISRGLTKH